MWLDFPSAAQTMKIHQIEPKGLKSVRHDKGVIEIGADMLVQPHAPRRHNVRP